MDYNDFKEFFKVHVKQYGPYRDSMLFQSFSNFLMDSYYNDSYSTIPSSFKSAFENQVLDSDYVIPFLLSLGIPSSEIDKISNSDRFKIINTVSDFHRYKGTVTLIDNLVANFDVTDNMAVYELYLDMSIDLNGAKIWNVLPKLIKAGASTRKSLELTTPLPFTILDKAPNWFIDELTLGDLYDSGELELPYKTNCILLDSTVLNKIEPIIQITSELVVETLKDTKIQLFFSDGVYLTTFSNMNALWYYISHKLNSVGSTNIPPANSHVRSGQDVFNRYVIPNLDGSLSRRGSNSLSSPLTNIQTLIDEFAILSTSDSNSKQKIDAFYADNINIFSSFSFSKLTTFAEYRLSVSSIIGVELLNYIDNRLANSTNQKNEANLIHSEIYNSILTYKSMAVSSSNNMNMDYLDYYFLNLPGLIKDITHSTTYIMLNLLKPYHVDLLDNRNYKVVVDSKFNNALVGYAEIFQTIYTSLTNSNVSENSVMSPTTINHESVRSLNGSIFNAIYNSLYNPSTMTVSHSELFQLVTMYSSVSNVSEYLKDLGSTTAGLDNLQSIDSSKSLVSSMTVENIRNIERLIISIITPGSSSIVISDQINQLLVIFRYWDSVLASMGISFVSNHRDQSLDIVLDKVFPQSTAPGSSMNNISDYNKDPYAVLRYSEPIQFTDHFNNLKTSHPFRDLFIQIEKQLNSIMIGSVEITTPGELSFQFGIHPNYDNLPVTDVATSYIYDNPITGIHTIYTN